LGNPSCTQLDYGVRVTNNSQSAATEVHFTYVLPVDPQLGVAAASFLRFPANCAIQNTTSLNCSLGTLQGRASVLIAVQISVSTAVTAQLVQNRAWVESDATDPLAGNNAEAKNLSVNQQTIPTDLQLVVNGPPSIKVFNPLAYFIKITNARPGGQ